jgi:hypothetical protein
MIAAERQTRAVGCVVREISEPLSALFLAGKSQISKFHFSFRDRH